MPPIHDPLFEAQVQQIFTITQKPLNHIRSDLRFTKNVELTIARAFHGEFLKGTDRDPERRIKFWEEEKGEATKEGASQAKTQAHTVASLAEKIFSSSPRVTTHQSLPPLESSPIAGRRTQMEDDPIMFTSSAGQQVQKKKRKAEVVEILSDDDEELVPLPAPKRVPVSRRETKKPRKDESLDLKNVAVYDLSQSERRTAPPAVTRKDVVANTPTMLPESFRLSTPDTAANGSGGFVRDDISSSPPKITAKPISMDDDDFDDSLWNDNLWKNYESPEPAPKKPSPINLISDDDDDDDKVPLLAPPAPKAKPNPNPKPAFSAATLALLNQFESDTSNNEPSNPDSDNNPRPTKAPKPPPTNKPPPASSASAVPKRGRLSEEEKARRAAEKAEKATLIEARKAAKAAKAVEKQREQEILSVNKLHTSKKDSCPEMLVDISTVLARDGVGKQLIGFLTNLSCEVNPNWRPALGIEGTWKIVKWRRKVKATYDEGLDMFLPLPIEEIRDENHLLVHLTAQEFVDLVSPPAGVDMDLTTHVQKMKSLLPAMKDIRVIYMIEGLAAYTRKSKTHEDRAFREQVLSAISSTTITTTTSRRPKTPTISESTLETSLLTLQLTHNCLLHHTISPLQSSEWISIFTSDISNIPYKSRRQTGFLGQVKTGIDAEDTMVKMLQEIHRVTPGVARGVVEEFGDVKSLVRAVRRRGGGVMEDVRMGCTKSGARSNRLIGRAVSERIAGVFVGRDEGALEV